jgi:hypothetical protein
MDDWVWGGGGVENKIKIHTLHYSNDLKILRGNEDGLAEIIYAIVEKRLLSSI